MNFKKFSIKSLTKICAVILSFCICICFFACDNDTDYESEETTSEKTIEKSSKKKEKDDKKQAEKDDDVITLVFEADTQESVTDKELESVKSIMITRLDSMENYEAAVSLNNEQIEVTVSKDIDTQAVIDLLTAKANVEFKDKDDNIIIDSNDIYDATSGYADKNYYVLLTFTDEGKNKFSDATEIISKYENGENYIAIYIDNIEISRPSVKQKIDSTDCQITGDFEAEDVSYLASQIGSGTLPFDLKVVGEK